MSPLNPPITQWRRRRVWVIGAGSGIGKAICQQLQSRGVRLALSGRNPVALQNVVRQDDLILALDVSDPEQLNQAYQQIEQAWQGVDLVIYCAGTYAPMRAWDIDLQVVQQTFSANLQGSYHLLKTIVPGMLDHGHGGICLVASVAGYCGLPKALAYGPSKAAMINLAETLYTDLRPRGIGVYLVNPGFVKTRLTQQNDFTMPALISPELAADEIIRGLERGLFEIHFPRRFTRWMKLLAMLPSRLRFALLKRASE